MEDKYIGLALALGGTFLIGSVPFALAVRDESRGSVRVCEEEVEDGLMNRSSFIITKKVR
jgi:hypothetical protein